MIVGCARWSKDATQHDSTDILPPAQSSPDSVVVETVLVRFPQTQHQELDAIWKAADESVLSIELRRELQRNGLRAGVIVGDLPEIVRKQLDVTSQDQTTDALEHAGLAADVDNRMRQLHCRSGKRKELIVRRELTDPLTAITTLNGELQGETFHRATVLFDLRVVPTGANQAEVELIPEVQHGDMKQSFVSTEFGIRPEVRRPRQQWRELSMKLNLRANQVFAVAATLPPKALGTAFFTTKTADQSEQNVVLLLRVADTQVDELFQVP